MVDMHKLSKEIARDLVALGSIPFFALVATRAAIGTHTVFVYQLLTAAAILGTVSLFVKGSDNYLARGIVLFVFTSIFYNAATYTIFAFLMLLLLFTSLAYLRRRTLALVKGTTMGALCSAAGYHLAPYLQKFFG